MKLLRLRIVAALGALALSALACGLPDVTSLLNPLPSDDFSNSSSGW